MYDLFLSSFTNFVARLCTDSNVLICFTLHGFLTSIEAENISKVCILNLQYLSYNLSQIWRKLDER